MNKDKSIMEAIALKHVPCRCDESYKSRGLEAPDCPYHSTDPQEAMKEWAKQQAIAFAEWLPKFRNDKMGNASTKAVFKEWAHKPISEYFQLFLQSQQ